MTTWRYQMSAYYALDVKPPKTAGDLAITVGLANESMLDTEVLATQRRTDIGRIVTSGPESSRSIYRTEDGWTE